MLSFSHILGPISTIQSYVVREGALIHFYCALSTLCSSPGTCTSTTLSLWNQNHSLTYQSWNDCKFILSDLSPKISKIPHSPHTILKIIYLEDSAAHLIETRKLAWCTWYGIKYIGMTCRMQQNVSYKSVRALFIKKIGLFFASLGLDPDE